jgi:ubiquinone/menaquinone biosynthesis C-methylase UbiE
LLEFLHSTDVTGVDVSESQVARAKERIPSGTFYVQAGESLRIERTFDFIIISETVNFAGKLKIL